MATDGQPDGILLPDDAEIKPEIVIRFKAPDSVEFDFRAGRTTIQQWLVAARSLMTAYVSAHVGASEIRITFEGVGSAKYEIQYDVPPLMGQIISVSEWLEWRAKFFLSLAEAQKQQQAHAEMVKRMKLVQQLKQTRPPS